MAGGKRLTRYHPRALSLSAPEMEECAILHIFQGVTTGESDRMWSIQTQHWDEEVEQLLGLPDHTNIPSLRSSQTKKPPGAEQRRSIPVSGLKQPAQPSTD